MRLVCFVAGIMLVCQCRTPDARYDTVARPNILFVISDDQSWPHASAYGTQGFHTPAFDRVAREGVLFTQAFVAAPQCSPSRAALLTGRPIWQLEEAGTHGSYFPSKFEVFTQNLGNSGYAVGYTGKAWGPGNWQDAGWKTNPVGEAYNEHMFDEVPYKGLHRLDYARNFQAFLDAHSEGEPFFFWFGAHEPHRVYEYGSGRRAAESVQPDLPPFLPSTDSIANDMHDYALEISWFDKQLARMLTMLEERGMLDNTLVVVTSDNGMAFPHAKASLQEYGIHVPLAICGPGVAGGRVVDDLVSLIDLAPTFLEVSGATPLKENEGKSLIPLLRNQLAEPHRQFVLAGRERHTHARPDNLGYPARAMRTQDWLYIRNFAPERWPMGDPAPTSATGIALDENTKPIVYGYEDIDDSPSKREMIRRHNEWPVLFRAAFAKRPAEQLYNIREDPHCLRDLSGEPEYSEILGQLREALVSELTDQKDPRVLGTGDVFESYPRFGLMRPFPGFRERGAYNEAFRIHTND